jgi:hypothetical protein
VLVTACFLLEMVLALIIPAVNHRVARMPASSRADRFGLCRNLQPPAKPHSTAQAEPNQASGAPLGA